MGIRQADNENAVREGWARDEDNEVVMDGYNAIIQITTDDGTSGFEVQNSIGASSFLVDSDGDGYFAKRLGIGTENPEVALEVIGKTRTNELQVTSGAQLGYVLTSDGDGNASWLPSDASTGLVLDGYVKEETFQENKNAQAQINQSILQSLDGYAIKEIEDQRWIDSSQQLQDLRDSLDGYVVNPTFEENKNSQNEINNHILIALDGYAQNSTVTEHYQQLSQAVQDIVSTIDGYETKISAQENYDALGEAINIIRKDLDGYAQTEQEHQQQHSDVIQTILKDLDGYNQTISEHYDQHSNIFNTIIKDLDGYETKISAQENYDAIGEAINTIRKDLEDAYADISGSAADGYIVFFTGPTSIAGDNDLYFDRVNNQLQVSAFKLTTVPADGYVLTSDIDGNASWKLSPGAHHIHRALDQLVHNIAEDSFEEFTYSGAFVTNITVWNDNTKTIKIREEQFSYSGAFVSQIIIIQYNSNGIECERVTENYTYSGAFVTNIERILT